MISGDLKLASDWGRPWELFDLATDRTELHDLSKAQPEQAARLEKLWRDWAAKTDTRVHSAGGEPIYRHLADAEERFVGGGAASGDEEAEAAATKPKRRKAASEASDEARCRRQWQGHPRPCRHLAGHCRWSTRSHLHRK